MKSTVDALGDALEEAGGRGLLAGGFALQQCAVARQTLDVGRLIRDEDADRIVGVFEAGARMRPRATWPGCLPVLLLALFGAGCTKHGGTSRDVPPTPPAATVFEPVTDLCAYSFRSPLSMAEILERLNDLGPWEWIERDNDEWGEYISARVLGDPQEHGMVKLIGEDGRYVIGVHLRSDRPGAGAEFAAVREIVLKRVLPALDASDIVETDDIES